MKQIVTAAIIAATLTLTTTTANAKSETTVQQQPERQCVEIESYAAQMYKDGKVYKTKYAEKDSVFSVTLDTAGNMWIGEGIRKGYYVDFDDNTIHGTHQIGTTIAKTIIRTNGSKIISWTTVNSRDGYSKSGRTTYLNPIMGQVSCPYL